MAESPAYFQIPPDGGLPDVSALAPFRAVLLIEAPVTGAWQSSVSRWLVDSGCLYAMAWGHDCASWDDAIDIANLEQFDWGDIPEDHFVMTTWHANQSLADAFSFCKRFAIHRAMQLRNTVLLHIADRGDSAKVLKSYAEA